MKPLSSDTLGIADRLIPLLSQVSVDLQNLRLRAAALKEPADLGFCPHQMKRLHNILKEGRAQVLRRVSELGGPDRDSEDCASDPALPERESDPIAFMTEYRRCGRRLCTALRETLRVFDSSTGAILCELALSLEKQLWLLDRQPHKRGIEHCRSVSVFLAC